MVGDRGYFQWAGLSEEVMFDLTNEKPDLAGECSRWGQGLWGSWAVTAPQWKPALVGDD